MTTQLATEQTEMIRAGKLRALAVFSDKPLIVEGIDPIPPVTDWLPDMPIAADYFGVFIPKGAPQEVYDTVARVWEENVMNSEEMKSYASDRGAVFAPSYGEAALAVAMPVVIAKACARVTRGEAVVDPSTIGIECPAEKSGSDFMQQRAGSAHCLPALLTHSLRPFPPTHLRLIMSVDSRTADRMTGLVLLMLGIAMLVGGYTMDRVEIRQIHPASIPGLVPMGLYQPVYSNVPVPCGLGNFARYLCR